MRIIYLVTAIAFTIIGVIICFGNVMMKVNFNFFFTSSSYYLVFPLFLMLGTGMIAGFLYGLAFMTKDSGGGDEDGEMFE